MQNYIQLRKINKSNKPQKSTRVKSIIILSIFLALLTVLLQLFVMSEFATKGVEISELESRKEQLTKENLQLKSEINQAKNTINIEEKSKALGYIRMNTNEVKYINLESDY